MIRLTVGKGTNVAVSVNTGVPGGVLETNTAVSKAVIVIDGMRGGITEEVPVTPGDGVIVGVALWGEVDESEGVAEGDMVVGDGLGDDVGVMVKEGVLV